MKEKYQMENPSDARVFIDYGNKKNPIRFEYPNKESAFKIVSKFFLSNWIRINLRLIPILFVIFVFNNAINNPDSNLSFKLAIIYTGFYFYLFIIPKLISIIFVMNKKLLRMMPDLWTISTKIFNNGYYTQKIKKIDNRIFEIPLFENIFLDYNATGEFSKYLKKVEIKEYPVNYKKVKLRKTIKKERQTDYWKAQFIFSRIPKTGFLEVKFI